HDGGGGTDVLRAECFSLRERVFEQSSRFDVVTPFQRDDSLIVSHDTETLRVAQEAEQHSSLLVERARPLEIPLQLSDDSQLTERARLVVFVFGAAACIKRERRKFLRSCQVSSPPRCDRRAVPEACLERYGKTVGKRHCRVDPARKLPQMPAQV